MTETGKLTRNQSLVLDRLAAADCAKSAYDILGELQNEGIKAPLQVYRALDKLLEKGLAHRLESMNAFVACAEPHCHLEGIIGFAICETCGRVDEFSDEDVRARLDAFTNAKGFVPSRTTVEIRGTCANCLAA